MDSLAKLTQARQMLVEAKTLDDIMQIRDIAEAVRVYAQAAKLGLENQNEAAEIKLRAERKAGEMLARMPKAQGGEHYHSEPTGSTMQPVVTPPTLAEIGIKKTQAHRWQTIAKLPDEKFEEYIDTTKKQGDELTSAGVYKKQKKEEIHVMHAEKRARPLPEGKYSVIYADPPWQYNTEQHGKKEQDTVLETHYPTMTIDEICNLNVKDIADNDAVLFLWATSPLLPKSFKVIEAWGFEYKASFVWDKVKHNVGYYNSVRHEFLLVATRGSFLPEKREGEPILFDSVQSIERMEHSKKPEKFREIIEYLYPSGKKIELFARESSSGWEVWGNENV